MNIKKILGGIAAAGMALGGLVLAGKSEFGKNLGNSDPCEGKDPLALDDLDAAPPEPAEEPEMETVDPPPEAEE